MVHLGLGIHKGTVGCYMGTMSVLDCQGCQTTQIKRQNLIVPYSTGVPVSVPDNCLFYKKINVLTTCVNCRVHILSISTLGFIRYH